MASDEIPLPPSLRRLSDGPSAKLNGQPIFVHTIIFVHTCRCGSGSASSPGEARGCAEREKSMKHFLIKYRFKDGSPEAWRGEIERFIAAVEADTTLNGRIAYRCMKADNGSGEYYHLAATTGRRSVEGAAAARFLQAVHGRDQARLRRHGRGVADGDHRRDGGEGIARLRSRHWV